MPVFAVTTRAGVLVTVRSGEEPCRVQFGSDEPVALPMDAGSGIDLVASDVGEDVWAVVVGVHDDYGYLIQRRVRSVSRVTPGPVHGRYAIWVEPNGTVSWVPASNPQFVHYLDGRPVTPSRDTTHPLSPAADVLAELGEGVVVTRVIRSGGWAFGEDVAAGPGRTRLYAANNGDVFHVWTGYAPLPSFFVVHDDGTATVSVTTPRGIATPVTIHSSQFTAYVRPTGPIPPPVDEPEEPSMPDSLLPLIQAVRSTYPARVTRDQAVAMLNAVAWQARDRGWGLFRKPGGGETHGVRYDGTPCSVDWLVHRPSGTGGDVLGGASNDDGSPAPAVPTWPTLEPVDLRVFVDPIPPQGAPTPDPPPTPPTGDSPIAERLVALERRVTALEQRGFSLRVVPDP